jgi:endothelin-converting enzyme/putative endopeptidase
MLLRRLALVPALAAALASCEEVPPPVAPPAPAPPPSAAPAPPAARTDRAGVDEKALDRGVAPCTDFYQYACGGWLASTAIPAEESSWTRSFDVLQENNENMLREILERYARGEGKDEPDARKLGDYYATCMDEAAIEAAGTKAIEAELKQIDAIKTPRDLAAELAHLHARGVRAAFDFDAGQDFKDATQMIGILSQGGLGLPDRDYYLQDDPKMVELRRAYTSFIAALFGLVGEKPKDAAAHAATVLEVETTLARASMDKVEMRDPQKTYHRVDRAGLQKAAPAFPFDVYFTELGAGVSNAVTAVNLAMPEFMKAVGEAVERSPVSTCAKAKPAPAAPEADPYAASAAAPAKKAAPAPKARPCPPAPRRFPAAEWRTYLRAHLISGVTGSLPKRFVDEAFKLQRTLTGAEQLPPRWKRCVRSADGALGEALGRSFVQRTLGPEGKEAVKRMVGNIEAAMGENLAHLGWMDATTRTRAAEKLALVANKIGFPDRFRNYDALTVVRGDHFGNTSRARAFEARWQLAKIGRPVDRAEWDITPPTVNAYYNASMNEMVFPAGILQPPFFARDASLGRNYGAIGMVLGHELTHGYDDEGRQFDGHGNLRDWWMPTVSAEFERRADCVVKQFDGYVAVDDVHLNGKLTLGENLADLGGLKLALAAFRKDLAAHPEERAGGTFTDDQQFFLGFAQAWCTNMRPEMARLLATVNPHSMPRFRVDGPVSNLPEFAAAFSCAPGSPMVRAERCEVW